MRATFVKARQAFRPATVGVVILLGLAGADAKVFSRGRHEDAEVVSRSELIVVGRLLPGSIRKEDFRDELGGGVAHVHHARLIITEVIKGDLKEKEIPIIVHYGLLPVEGRDLARMGLRPKRHDDPDDEPQGGIRIGDMSMHSFIPLRVGDAGQDNLWFLRKRKGYFGQEPGVGDYGIVDPEDLQPIALKPYLLAYLSSDPEQAVRREMAANPVVGERGQRYLDKREIGRILMMDDPRVRVERLLPYFAKGLHGGNYFAARHGIVACGEVAGPSLRPLFRSPESPFLRQDIITMWGEIRYRACVPELISLLETHERDWAAQRLEPDWWNRDVQGDSKGRLRDLYCEDQDSVRALGRIGDRRARPAIEAVRRRWVAVEFEPREIVKACDDALKALAE